jgi:hypothetical protein
MLELFWLTLCGLANGYSWTLLNRLALAYCNQRRLVEIRQLILLFSAYIGILLVPGLWKSVVVASVAGSVAALFGRYLDLKRKPRRLIEKRNVSIG